MTKLDAADLSIHWQRLISIADEMAASITRTAFSSVVRESNDLACGLLTPEGQLIVEYSRSIPPFIGALTFTARALIDFFGVDDLTPGDVLATNDPWLGNTHLPDMTVLTPIFHQDELVAFSGSICHLSDIGGTSEGGFSRDIYEEGFCLPPTKIYGQGRRNDELLRVLARNVRVPQMVLGDVESLVVANRTGAKRVADLLTSSPGLRIDTLASQIADLTESATRRSIQSVPAGTYSSQVRIDGYESEKEIHVTITVAGETIVVDFTGTSAQSTFGFNASGSSWGYAMYPLKCLLNPDLPNNAGAHRPITITIPPGTILNPTPPAGVAAGFPAHMIQGVICNALHAAIPDRVMAASGAPFWAIGLKGRIRSRAFAGILCLNGGQGAMHGRDGYACLSTPSNISNAPIEVIEAEVPVLFEQKAIARRSGGRGQWRGGAGQDVRIRSTHDAPISCIFLTDRIKNAANGLAGGQPGGLGRLLVDGRPVREPKGRMQLAPGSTIQLRTPGGGGFGAMNGVRKPSTKPGTKSAEDRVTD